MPRPQPILAALALALFAGPATTADADPAPDQIETIVRYHDSGDWARDTTRVTQRASTYLRARVRRVPAVARRRLIAVFDVDDTALSTYDCMKAGDFTDARRTACVVLDPHPAIPQTLALFGLARRLGLRVAFVTGRPDMIRTTTLAQLRAAGYRGRYELALRPTADQRASVIPFKTSARRRLQRGGARVVLDVGDQRSDLAGGVAQRTFKLPNPMYVLP
jgi:acid phosphatase